MAVVFLAMSWFNSTAAKKEVEYNQIVAEFLTDQVGEYRLDLNTRTLTYTLWKDMESKTPPAENASPESSSGASSSEAANPLTPFQPQPAQSKAKTYQVPSTDLFIRAPTGKQLFKYMSLWKNVSFRPLHSSPWLP